MKKQADILVRSVLALRQSKVAQEGRHRGSSTTPEEGPKKGLQHQQTAISAGGPFDLISRLT